MPLTSIIVNLGIAEAIVTPPPSLPHVDACVACQPLSARPPPCLPSTEGGREALSNSVFTNKPSPARPAASLSIWALAGLSQPGSCVQLLFQRAAARLRPGARNPAQTDRPTELASQPGSTCPGSGGTSSIFIAGPASRSAKASYLFYVL